MTGIFPCERCGRLVRIPPRIAAPARCPHCHRRLVVPPTLAELPYPQAPTRAGSAGAQHPPPRPPVLTVATAPVDGDGDAPTTASRLTAMLISLVFHMGLALIFLFVTMVMTPKPPKRPITTENFVTAEISNPFVPRPTPWDRKTHNKPQRIRRLPESEQKLGEILGKQERPLATPLDLSTPSGGPRGRDRLGPGGRGGDGPFSPRLPNAAPAAHIVYVVDRSGSMHDDFDLVRMRIVRSVSLLSDKQDFHVVLFNDGPPLENPARRLVAPTHANKIDLVRFLKPVIAEGTTDPVPALRRAFDALAGVRARGPKLIHLLTDGHFPNNQAVLKLIRERNAGRKVHINTYLYRHRPTEAQNVLKTIAEENGGRYRYVCEDDDPRSQSGEGY